MKKMLIALLLVSTLLAGTNVAYAENNFLMVNNYKVKSIYYTFTEDAKGVITGLTLMVPLRDVAENALGYKVDWNPATMTATVTTTEHKAIKFTEGSRIICISNDNGQAEYTIPENDKVVENRDMLYVPEKAIIDVFGLEQRPVYK